MSWLVPLEVLAHRRGGDDARAIGGKAARLVWLQKHGFDVPEAWVLSQDAFARALTLLPPSCEPRALLRAASGKTGANRAAEARQELSRVELPEGLQDELDELWEGVESRAPWGLAVRSSATCEDGELVSMAGLAETVLGVRGGQRLGDAVRQVWASVASGRALAYLATRGVRDVSMGVVFQRVVEAEVAGVMFTRAPDARGGEKQRIVNVGLGLGAPVVNGLTTPDVFRMDARGRIVENVVAHKATKLVVGAAGLEDIAVDDPEAPALSRERVGDLAELALRLEKLDAVPWDVEFACDRQRTWILQARPITGRGYPDGGTGETVWSNANVGEALPGVATPLTWSIAGAFSEEGFHHAFASLGCRVPRSAKLVANVHGRFYLNLTQFMRIAAQVPWLNPQTLVELGGGGGGEELALQVAGVSPKAFLARLPVTGARVLLQQLRLHDEVARFETYADNVRRLHGALDLAILPDEGVARKIRDLQAVLSHTGTVMLSCASSALGSHLALKVLLERVAPLDAERLAQALTSGIRDIESARPAIAIQRIVSIARREPEAQAALLLESTASLDALPEGQTRRALLSFFELYGDRAVREAELSTPRWGEEPRPVFTMLRVALRGASRDIEAALLRSRTDAETETRRLTPKLNLIEQVVLRQLVARAQKAARWRELMRAWVTRTLGMLRQTVLEGDRRLLRREPALAADQNALVQKRSPLAAIGPSFFLTVDELVGALRASRADLAPLVRARRAEFARDQSRPDPPSTFVGAPPRLMLPPLGGDVFRGLSASPGIVEGRVRVLQSVDEFGLLEPGEVLVARTTDVGWTPLFPLATGVVTELGGPLSHAAVVARELGVPSVVNVRGATRALRTGDWVRVDGDRGVVERVGR